MRTQIAELNERINAVRQSHDCRDGVSLINPVYEKAVDDFFTTSVLQDINPCGDISTKALSRLIPKNAKAVIVSKCSGIAAGFAEATFLLRKSFPFFSQKINFKADIVDGQKIRVGQRLAVISGSARDLLVLERTLLNMLQRMSGVATITAEYVSKVPNNVLIAPTRKTLLGLLDKKAVTVGGGGTHRLNLSDAILMKDNHLKLLRGDMDLLFGSLAKAKNTGRFLEVEVGTTEQARSAVEAYTLAWKKVAQKIPLYLMFDNFKAIDIKKTIGCLRGTGKCENIYFEASGGINLDNIREYAKTGIDIISCGALTHSATSLDISLEIM